MTMRTRMKRRNLGRIGACRADTETPVSRRALSCDAVGTSRQRRPDRMAAQPLAVASGVDRLRVLQPRMDGDSPDTHRNSSTSSLGCCLRTGFQKQALPTAATSCRSACIAKGRRTDHARVRHVGQHRRWRVAHPLAVRTERRRICTARSNSRPRSAISDAVRVGSRRN